MFVYSIHLQMDVQDVSMSSWWTWAEIRDRKDGNHINEVETGIDSLSELWRLKREWETFFYYSIKKGENQGTLILLT
jgi:hypothetical protein